MNIQFLTRQVEIRSTHELVLEAKNQGHNVSLLDISLFSISFQKGLFYNNSPWHPVDLVYPFWAKKDTFLPVVLQMMSRQKQRIYKSITQPLPTKLSAALLLQQAGLPTPKTITGNSLKGLLPLIKEYKLPCIVKLSSSSQGKGVFLHHEYRSLIEHVQSLCAQGIDFVVQECLYPTGKDIRAFVINDKVVAAMERTSTTGDFRANISLGGIGAKTLLSHEEDRLVRHAAQVFGLRMSGVDFMRTNSGPVLLEVNKEPGFKGITAATKINVAQKVIEDFVHFCSDGSSNNSERNMHIAMSTI